LAKFWKSNKMHTIKKLQKVIKMSNFRIVYLLSFLCVGVLSCGRNESPAPELSTKIKYYAPFSIGSSFSYSSSLGNYTNTVQSDTVITGKVYNKIMNSKDGYTAYYYFSEGEYKVSGVAPVYVSGVPAELNDFTYLKDNLPVNSTWNISVPINSGGASYTARFDFKIMAKEIVRTVNGKTYSGVVQVEQKIYSISGTSIKETGTYLFWYAKGVGLIETDALTTKISNYSLR
jgi:hypothetical protein